MICIFFIGCTSLSERAKTQIKKNQSAIEIVENEIKDKNKKEIVKDALENSNEIIEALDKEKTKAEKQVSSLRIYRILFFGVIAFSFFIFVFLRR